MGISSAILLVLAGAWGLSGLPHAPTACRFYALVLKVPVILETTKIINRTEPISADITPSHVSVKSSHQKQAHMMEAHVRNESKETERKPFVELQNSMITNKYNIINENRNVDGLNKILYRSRKNGRLQPRNPSYKVLAVPRFASSRCDIEFHPLVYLGIRVLRYSVLPWNGNIHRHGELQDNEGLPDHSELGKKRRGRPSLIALRWGGFSRKLLGRKSRGGLLWIGMDCGWWMIDDRRPCPTRPNSEQLKFNHKRKGPIHLYI